MKAYVLVNPNNNRLVDNKIPTYPSILPKYSVIYGPTADTITEIPDWYIEYHGCPEIKRRNGYCAYLGHTNAIIDHYKNYPNEPLLVMEDDVEFIPNFNEYYSNFMKMVPDNWDAIYLGGWYSKSSRPVEKVPNVLKPSSLGYIFGAECIILSPKLIKLLDSYLKYTPITERLQFDGMLACWSKKNIINTYSPIVMFAHQKPGFSAVAGKIMDRDCNINNFTTYIAINNTLRTANKADLARYRDK